MRFLKLTLPKFFAAALLFAIFAAISPSLYRYLVLDAHLRGLPLPFAMLKDGCALRFGECRASFFFGNFAIDLVFWYLVASFLFYLNEVIKKG